MPIPDYQNLMLPLLRFHGDGKTKSLNDAVEALAREFSLSDSELREMHDARIVLLDGEKLAALMIDHGLGVTLQASYDVKRIDSDYFAED